MKACIREVFLHKGRLEASELAMQGLKRYTLLLNKQALLDQGILF